MRKTRTGRFRSGIPARAQLFSRAQCVIIQDILMPRRALFFGLYFVAAVLAAITSWHFAAFTADDAYIVARYALNARDVGDWAFNPGEPVSALTSPLHGLVLIGLSVLASD